MRWVEFISFLFFICFVYPWLRLFQKTGTTWVIGGHGGRAYGDNSAALHRLITREKLRDIVWITGNREVYLELRSRGAKVQMKNTLRARHTILKAPVLIRSHGDGDLDDWLLQVVTPPGMRIHLNHSMNFLKAGQMLFPGAEKLTDRERKKRERRLAKFDYLLACSKKEQDNFRRSMPHLAPKIILGGGAHLDLLRKSDNGPEDLILYFPTWRDADIRSDESVEDQIKKLSTSRRLHDWLIENNYRFVICRHLNTAAPKRQERHGRHVEFAEPGELTHLLPSAAVFISDYSGVILDAVFLDKPVIFFPFDLEAYLKVRSLYQPYEEFAFGPVVKTANELIELLTTSSFKDCTPWLEARAERKRDLLSEGITSYARRSFDAVVQLQSGIPPEDIK